MQGLAGRSVGHPVAAEEMARQGLLATGTDGAALVDDTPNLFESGSSLREAAAARIAAHRNRRVGAQAMEAAREEARRHEHAQTERLGRRGASRVSDTVRARYENTQSYRDFLAVEAERATQQARAEAEIAARKAQAIADAQMQLLEELREQEPLDPHPVHHLDSGHFEREPHRPEWSIHEARAGSNDIRFDAPPQSGDLFADPFADVPLTEVNNGGLTVRLYDDFGPKPHSLPEITQAPRIFAEDSSWRTEELEELEQEIAFRRAPEFIDHIVETLPIPTNLIEFPRELVAPRKARPRLAEGPLREELSLEPQLRIFEVEPETISTEPAVSGDSNELATGAPVWQGLLLDTPRVRAVRPQQESAHVVQLADIAPISRRLMAAAVDACCIGAALVGFATAVSYISGPRLQAMSHPMLAIGVLATLAISTLLYQLLFFSLNDATPGMRYAHIGLCTFADGNPSRGAMRRRVLATVLAACPLGLGLLWAWLDDDRLGWHDRISRMYHRSY